MFFSLKFGYNAATKERTKEEEFDKPQHVQPTPPRRCKREGEVADKPQTRQQAQAKRV
jgi:hypothetical protein